MGSELSPGSRKAKNVPGCMNRSTASRLADVIIPLSSALVRLYPEYCIQFWSEFSRGPPRMLRGLEHLPCEEKLWGWGGLSWLRDGFGSAHSSPQHLRGRDPGAGARLFTAVRGGRR